MKIPLFLKKRSSKSTRHIDEPLPRHADFSLISHFAESFNTLRANLRFARPDTPAKVILITGTTPREGKTTVAVNLAESMAYAGQKILLVEGDLRLPSFKNVFSCDHKKGISSLISETFDTPVENGSLGSVTLGDLITLIDLQEKTGTLAITDNSDEYRFSFEMGKLVSSAWKNRPQKEHLAAVLVRSGTITVEQAREAVNRARETGHGLGFILLNIPMVTPDHLRGPTRLQIIDTLGRAFSLSGAKYRFHETSQVKYERQIIDPIGLADTLSDELHGLRIRPFLKEQISSSIVETDVKNLYVLPAGSTPPNPSEVLGSRRIAVLMSMLKDTFDYEALIIDSPPVISVSDASILSVFADGVIMVVCAGTVNQTIIQKAMDRLKQVNAPVLGFVLNRMDPNEERRYYGYYYKYKYYDYYYKGKEKRQEAESKEEAVGSRQ